MFAEHKTLVASSDVLALENERLLDENTSLVVACTLLAEVFKQLDELNTGHGSSKRKLPTSGGVRRNNSVDLGRRSHHILSHLS